jgi:hypothetical protein
MIGSLFPEDEEQTRDELRKSAAAFPAFTADCVAVSGSFPLKVALPTIFLLNPSRTFKRQNSRSTQTIGVVHCDISTSGNQHEMQSL